MWVGMQHCEYYKPQISRVFCTKWKSLFWISRLEVGSWKKAGVSSRATYAYLPPALPLQCPLPLFSFWIQAPSGSHCSLWCFCQPFPPPEILFSMTTAKQESTNSSGQWGKAYFHPWKKPREAILLFLGDWRSYTPTSKSDYAAFEGPEKEWCFLCRP
jgi:hypothetical protein